MKPSVTKIIKKGHMLLSWPRPQEDTFARSVIYLTDHDDQGTTGLILNRPLGVTINELITGLDTSIQLYYGGPVKRSNLYYMHTRADLIPNAIPLADTLFWAGNFEHLRAQLLNGNLNNGNIKFFMGCTSWYPGQLSDELDNGVWTMIEGIESVPFSNADQDLWKTLMIELGGMHKLWSNAPDDPSWN